MKILTFLTNVYAVILRAARYVKILILRAARYVKILILRHLENILLTLLAISWISLMCMCSFYTHPAFWAVFWELYENDFNFLVYTIFISLLKFGIWFQLYQIRDVFSSAPYPWDVVVLVSLIILVLLMYINPMVWFFYDLLLLGVFRFVELLTMRLLFSNSGKQKKKL